jgi:hypothetical protein
VGGELRRAPSGTGREPTMGFLGISWRPLIARLTPERSMQLVTSNCMDTLALPTLGSCDMTQCIDRHLSDAVAPLREWRLATVTVEEHHV